MSALSLRAKRSGRVNMLCLLPNTCIKVILRAPHPCGGWYNEAVYCYGPHGMVGYWMEDR